MSCRMNNAARLVISGLKRIVFSPNGMDYRLMVLLLDISLNDFVKEQECVMFQTIALGILTPRY